LKKKTLFLKETDSHAKERALPLGGQGKGIRGGKKS